MCGICGQAGRRPDAGRLRAALSALAHRGPDGEGEWLGPASALGHRRLAIIDLSARADQPMANEDGSVVLVFNGEIYNFAPLRRELEGRHRFRSDTDSEVLVHGYEEWGIDGLLRRVRGMFAFALWDAARAELHLARDRVGKKPLFYALDGGVLSFASTLPALVELRGATPEVDPRAVADYLVHLSVPGERTMFRGVHKLPPGHRAELSGGRLRLARYWELSFARQEKASEEEWLERIDAELRRAVRERLVSDVPLGVFLSGGVDSSLVAAVMARESTSPVTTISAGFEEEGHDELPHARRVARHLGADHHELMIRAGDAAELPRLVHAAGEPFADQAILPTMRLARAAREVVTVVLTGDGGDESFAGYPSVLAARLAGGYAAVLPAALRARVPDFLRALQRRGGPAGRRARQLLRLAIPAAGRELEWRFDPLAERGFRGAWREVLDPAFAARLSSHDPDAHWRAAWEAADGPTVVDRVLQTEIATLLPDMFLVKSDAATMAYGLEARSPLLDTDLMELAARIPASTKLRGWTTKPLLKRLAERYVPPEVLYRPKHGFTVPTGAWMRGELGAAAAEVLLSAPSLERGILRPAAVRRILEEHRGGRADHGQRIWALLQLELWMRMFVDRTLSAGETLPVREAAAA